MCMMSRRIGDLAAQTKTPRLQGSVNIATAMEVLDIHETDILGVECEDTFAGVFSRSDFNKAITLQNLQPKEAILYETMPLNTPTISWDASVKETYEAMMAYQWKYMPVLRGSILEGIISLNDLAEKIMRSYQDSQSQNEMLLHYIQTGESYAIADYKM